jgi:hypothetical protein
MQLDESDFARHDGTIAVAGTDSRTDTAFPVSDAAHALLRLGRLMLVSGAAIEHVQKSVVALAQRLGYEAHLLVFAEGLLLTLLNKKEFHTKLGPSIAREATNMKALSELDDIVCRGLKAPPTPEQIEQDLNTIERGSRYPEWLVALGLGLTAASLARLFGRCAQFGTSTPARDLRHQPDCEHRYACPCHWYGRSAHLEGHSQYVTSGVPSGGRHDLDAWRYADQWNARRIGSPC